MDSPRLSFQDETGQRLIELTRESTTLGRATHQDIVLPHPQVSRHHATILRQQNFCTVIDQNSTHGTFVNGIRIQQAILKPGDVIHLGSMQGPQLTFFSQPDQGAPDAANKTQSIHQILAAFESTRKQPTASAPARDLAPARLEPAREMERLTWLLSAARQLNAGEALEDVLVALLQLTLKLTSVERGFVFLNHEDRLDFAKGLTCDGATVTEDSTISRQAVKKALESKASFYLGDTLSGEANQWQSVIANEIRTIYCIPLRTRGMAEGKSDLLGLLYLDSRLKPGSLTEVDHQILELIATEASALLHNAILADQERKARQAREELAVAARIHSGLMSIALPTLSYAVVHAKTVPCLAIGGDFYDVIALEDHVCLTIVDVSGKGVSAAIVAATLQGIIHAQLLAELPLAQVAAMVNQFLCSRDVGKYATLIMLKLYSDGRVEYINCGHIPPIAIHGDQVRSLQQANLIVGLISGATYSSSHDRLRPSERLLLTTDGITEAENSAGEMFGESAFSNIAVGGDLEAILAAVAAFHAPEPAQDDCTLLEVQYTEVQHTEVQYTRSAS